IPVGQFNVPARGMVEAPFRLDTSRRGTFRLTFELSAAGETWRQSPDVKFAVVQPMKEVGDAEASAFGMNTHMEREPTPHLVRNMEVLAQCGVKWIRGWWGWGMCEKERGQFDWTEYDRQLSAVEGAGMRLMPILLRYYPQYEQAWAGKVDGIQRPPYRMEEWGAFVRKVVERYRGRVTAWELWNEPTMSGAGFTPQLYADLLRATAAPTRELDPKAKIVGFAGVEVPFIRDTLALGVAPLMDVVSEHSYSQVERPEERLPQRMNEVREVLAAARADKPIWHTEQGVGADDDGYRTMSLTEGDAAALYTRNLVTARSLGIEKYFWFSAQCSPTYGWAVFYENYIPRPRLVALNACASFLEGTAFVRSFRPNRNTYIHLFAGKTPVAVAWNLSAPATLRLPLRADDLRAFDLMGNPVPVTARGAASELELPAERPVYLTGAALADALGAASVTVDPPVSVTIRRGPGAEERVTVTNRSREGQDGVLDLPTAARADSAWRKHFHDLEPGKSLSFPLPSGAREVRVRVGNRETQELRVAAPR
ncbi:MAG: hypothetical protein QHJ73_12130, partial [Armatimonadota bacterium]|nr:hypothetical protein [Armatimonadota bacterium]